MEERKQIQPDELSEEDGELLPDREAMSIVTPGFERPVPLDPLDPAARLPSDRGGPPARAAPSGSAYGAPWPGVESSSTRLPGSSIL